MDEASLRALARRALARARNPSSAAAGAIQGAPPAPHEPARERFLGAAALAGLAPGTRVRLARGTRVTPLAREEAWRLGIELVEEGA